MDEDERQEFECLILEGFTEEEARELARQANDKVNRARLSGPRSADKDGHGRVPYISDFRFHETWDVLTPYTMDSRTDEERESDYARVEECDRLLFRIRPDYAEALDLYYGLTTGEPMGYTEIAETLGITRNAVEHRMRQGYLHLKRLVGAQKPSDDAERRRKRNERARARYAEQKEGIVRKYQKS